MIVIEKLGHITSVVNMTFSLGQPDEKRKRLDRFSKKQEKQNRWGFLDVNTRILGEVDRNRSGGPEKKCMTLVCIVRINRANRTLSNFLDHHF